MMCSLMKLHSDVNRSSVFLKTPMNALDIIRDSIYNQVSQGIFFLGGVLFDPGDSYGVWGVGGFYVSQGQKPN